MKENGTYDSYKEKNAKDQKGRRDRAKEGMKQLPKAVRGRMQRVNRKCSRQKMEQYQNRKKGITNIERKPPSNSVASDPATKNVVTGGYNTASARSKAFAKLKRSLPSAPVKARELALMWYRSFNENEQQEIVGNTKPSSQLIQRRGIGKSVAESVTEFYQRDDISRMLPNVKDCRWFIDPITGDKEQKQIRYLLYKLSKVYDLYIEHIRIRKLQLCY